MCPKDWLHFQQKCYYFGEGSKQWIQAKFTCSDLEGRLVSIHSQKEQVPRLSRDGGWQGGSRWGEWGVGSHPGLLEWRATVMSTSA